MGIVCFKIYILSPIFFMRLINQISQSMEFECKKLLQMNTECAVPENIHNCLTKGEWKFWGGGGVAKGFESVNLTAVTCSCHHKNNVVSTNTENACLVTLVRGWDISSAENSASEPPNLKIFWGKIPPDPPARLLLLALARVSLSHKKPSYSPDKVD